MGHYVQVRQQYLISPSHSSTAQARAVLVTGIPQEYLTESSLASLFSHLPGGVRQVWINRDLGDMPDLYNQRLKACQMLESAATSLLNKAIERNRKRLTNPAKFGDGRDIVSNTELTDFLSDPVTRDTLLEKLVSKHERPSHKLPVFSWIPVSTPLLGRKVDTIEWACEQIHELNNKLAQRREILARDIAWTTEAKERMHHIDTEKSNISIPAVPDTVLPYGTQAVVDFSGLKYPPADGAFILFNKQIAAHMAAQTLTHHDPYCMPYSLKYVEATPEDVIWKNLALNPYQRRLRVALSWTVGIVLMTGWTIPGRLRLNSAQSTFRAKSIYSVVCHDGLTSPARAVHDFLLQLRRQSHPHLDGYLLCGIAYNPLQVPPSDFTRAITLGRNHSKDTRGAQLNESCLCNQTDCACMPCCS